MPESVSKNLSRLTGEEASPLFSALVLNRYEVTYYQCVRTGFIQTDHPFWLEEAYSSAITALDLGIVSRNIDKGALTRQVVGRGLPEATRFLDFGGGYGMFTRLMRDHGFDFTHFDAHCDNLFAREYQSDALGAGRKYDLVTAWEVMEHLIDPTETLAQLLGVADSVLFSTELVPRPTPRRVEDWWYFAPETGQHISFYTREALEYLASRSGCYLHTDGSTNHLMTRRRLRGTPFRDSHLQRIRRKLARAIAPRESSRQSLLAPDFEAARKRLAAERVHLRRAS